MQPIRQQSSTTSKQRSSHGRRIASLRYLPSGLMLQLEAPFNKDFIATFKKSIPANKRLYDDPDRCWYVAKTQFDKLCHLLEQYFDETILLDFPAHEVSDSAYTTLYLLEGAPLEVVRAAYKALAQKYHPDRGGDVSIMQQINAAYKEILGELKNGD